jgi:alanine-synthesizing transaminase
VCQRAHAARHPDRAGWLSEHQRADPAGGRLRAQRDKAWELFNEIPGVSCVKPKGALYMFPRLDPKVYNIRDDQKMVFDLLQQEKLLLVQGTGFNWPDTQHFRVVFLPREDVLEQAAGKVAKFLGHYSQ